LAVDPWREDSPHVLKVTLEVRTRDIDRFPVGLAAHRMYPHRKALVDEAADRFAGFDFAPIKIEQVVRLFGADAKGEHSQAIARRELDGGRLGGRDRHRRMGLLHRLWHPLALRDSP